MKKGFTLAEVLITLGIIGIVAALTLPSLIQHFKKQEVETKLKRFYSVMNEAIKLSEIDNGDKLDWSYQTLTPTDFWNKYLNKYIKVLKVDTVSDSETYVYFADGSVTRITGNGRDYYFYINSKNAKKTHATQIRGKDNFVFTFIPIYATGECTPEIKYSCKKGLEPYVYDWDGKEETLKSGSPYSCKDGNRSFCTKIIQNNGWKIPDDYSYQF